MVAAIDLERHELLMDKVTPRTPKQTFVFDDKTRVLYGKEMGTLKDVPLGRRGRVEYEDRAGQRVVTILHVNGRAPVMKPVTEGATMTGTLRRVALTDREIVLIGPGARGPETETTLAVPETARVTRAGMPIGFGELREGEKVSVTADKRDGRWTAKTIQSGTTAAPAMTAKEPSNIVPRLRLLLRITDEVLKQMDGGKS